MLCGETVCSKLAAWLRLGATALVAALIDADVRVGRAVRLRSPVDAMRAFARDPTCRVEAEGENGRGLSALAIQRHYLAQVEAHVGDDRLPPWAGEVCTVWRATLDEIARGPDAVATKLDWAIKLALFRRHAERRGFAWEAVPSWTAVANGLADAVMASGHRAPTITVEDGIALVKRTAPERFARIEAALARHGLPWSGLRPFLDLKHELCEIDSRYGQLGTRGIFGVLERRGVLEDDAPGVDDVGRALEVPPEAGRGRARGEAIRSLARGRQRAIADWHGVWDKRRGRMLDLGNPFSASGEWRPWQDDADVDISSLLRRG